MSLQDAINALKNNDFEGARLKIGPVTSSFTVQHFLIKGLAELSLKDWASARETFACAITRVKGKPFLWLNKGIAEENLGLSEDAMASYEACLAVDPSQALACGNLSNLYRNANRLTEAETMARRALDLGADKAEALNCLGLALARQGKAVEAKECFEQALTLNPNHPLALTNMADLFVDALDFDKAWPLFAKAHAITDSPDIRRTEGLARLLAGDFVRGFSLFEARLEEPAALRHRPACPLWDGKPLGDRRLLVVAEQGLGDVIHFCRYQHFLNSDKIVWAVPRPLVRLLSPSLRGTVVDEDGDVPACDVFAPIASLPWLLRDALSGEALAFPPVAMPYLNAPMEPILPLGTHKLSIGLVWAGSFSHKRDRERSIPLEILAALLDCVEADFYAPFIGKALDQIGPLPLTRLDDRIHDFADTASLLNQLDVLVCVDTAIAHLAGALGVRTFLLLPFCPDWRWGKEGNISRLYPSVTLVRQPSPGDWEGAVKKLIKSFPSD
ncbi:MAG: tetratricopeptide repeat protein [Alphaproteobacteria bacterium]|nr:tetratricopeptide repeat protein [Alphaproteobacteria bacterium]